MWELRVSTLPVRLQLLLVDLYPLLDQSKGHSRPYVSSHHNSVKSEYGVPKRAKQDHYAGP